MQYSSHRRIDGFAYSPSIDDANVTVTFLLLEEDSEEEAGKNNVLLCPGC